MTTNATDTPTLNVTCKHPNNIEQPAPFKQSSFGSVAYDSNRKTREGASFEDQRVKQASSLSPSRLISDMSR